MPNEFSNPSVNLLAQGKNLRKEGRLDEAIELLARAVEARMAEEGSEISATLGEYLIEYADSLLCKEESHSHEILGPHNANDTSDSDEEGTTRRLDSGRVDGLQQVDEGEEEEVLSDLQLAWESFEHARLCVLSREECEERMKDLSFIHCRLGDIQALQDQFSASIADYAESVKLSVACSQPARKVAGLLVSLSQTIQALMTSEEIKAENFNEIEFVEKFKQLFDRVTIKYSCTALASSGNAVALIARDGFLLANNLLSKVQSSDASVDLNPTINELQACADDCLNQQSEISAARVVVPGVTSGGFARPSGNQATSSIVTVAVKRKAVSGEQEPETKKTKEVVMHRAEKAKLVD